jgi:gluconate 5-dehydrogenase
MGASEQELTGRVAIVTGAGAGIGAGIAATLAEAGAAVAVADVDGEGAASTAKAIEKRGGRAITVTADVSDAREIDAMVRQTVTDLGGIDILVNNAGIQRRSPLEQFDEKVWREVLDINLTGLFLVTQQVVQGMIARKSGKIINICSVMSEVSRPTIGAYTAAKGAVKQLTKSMAVEWAKHNIQANGIGPGYILTEMNRALIEDGKFDAWVCARTPAGRWADPSELVGAAVFLASRASDFVNGQIIYVDGGILASL